MIRLAFSALAWAAGLLGGTMAVYEFARWLVLTLPELLR